MPHSRKPILVTGVAGFIGFHVASALLSQGRPVVGIDSLSDYYDVRLKQARLAVLQSLAGFTFTQLDLADRAATAALFDIYRFRQVIHLAAQVGVRYSLVNPHIYVDANLQGFANVLEGCRHQGCQHLLYASSSSVYGANTKLPFSVHDNVDHPLSFYGATKKANELMAHSYSHLFALPATGLRFFTVYGPWGRPDMAVWTFTECIAKGQPIKLFNDGNMQRDFTYVDDVVEAVVRLVDRPPVRREDGVDGPGPGTSSAPWRVYNIGNNKPVRVLRLIEVIEKELGRTAERELLPMQPGDMLATYADIDDLVRDVGFRPSTTIEDGIRRFVAWYREYASR